MWDPCKQTPTRRCTEPAVYEGYYRELRTRREGSGGTREYILSLMLLKDHPLPQVTAAVEQASRYGLCGYEAVKTFLGEEPTEKLCAVSLVWPNRVDHFDLLVSW